MKYRDLDGKEFSIDFKKFTLVRNKVSSGHLRARQLIKDMFPSDRAFEEVSIPVQSRQTLYADFFIPSRRILVEVHGEQHYTKNSFFHKTEGDFSNAKARDTAKQLWCEENELSLITLNAKDDDDVWREKISKRETS